MTLALEVGFLGVDEADDATVAAVVALVNRAYDDAERELWTREIARTNAAEVAASAAAGELVVASLDGRPVGAVFTRIRDDGAAWFGALGVDRDVGGRGIGGRLVDFVEEIARARGAPEMELELLVPEGGQPHTDRLAAWYERRGYRKTQTVALEAIDPGSVPLAAVPIRVAIMRRPLG